MMTEEQIKDSIVAIRTIAGAPIGSGFLYFGQDSNYIITCLHCVVADSRDLGSSLNDKIMVIQQLHECQEEISVTISLRNNLLVDKKNDIAVIILDNSSQIFQKVKVECLLDNSENKEYKLVGFPLATLGIEHCFCKGEWNSKGASDCFYITLRDDISDDNVRGLSGGGAFVEIGNVYLLNGIVEGIRGEEKGRVIKTISLAAVNKLLSANFREPLNISFVGINGIDEKFFKDEVKQAIYDMSQCNLLGVNITFDIASYFDCVAKTSNFYHTLWTKLDDWILDKHRIIGYTENKKLQPVVKALRDEVVKWYTNLSQKPDEIIEIDSLNENAKSAKEQVRKAIAKYQEDEIEKDERSKDQAISIMYSYDNYFGRLISSLDERKINLSNSPFLIIWGEAGCGKSHLFADTADKRAKMGLPTILLHARNFSGDKTIEDNIITQLKLRIDFRSLMESFNRIGLDIGSRVLILIDAINETRNRELWRNNLSGLIQELKSYPGVAMAVSVRDTYKDETLPVNIKDNPNVTLVEHTGFTGNIYEVLKQFCEFYDINFPNFPVLNEEYRNPLFLHLVCRVVKEKMHGDLERGLYGLYKIFDEYKGMMDSVFDKKRPEYKRHKVITRSIDAIVRQLLKDRTDAIPLLQAEKLLQEKVIQSNLLLNDLIDEFVLKMTKRDNGEYVTFAYERMGEFYEAMEIAGNLSQEDIDNYIDKSTKRDTWNRNIYGIMDQLAIVLPETCEKELYEITKNRYVGAAVFNSLLWRPASSLNQNKLVNYFRKSESGVGDDEWLTMIYRLSCIPGNPFNGDYLCRIMNRFSMPERDGWFQSYLYNYTGNSDSPIERLIDWAWTPGISKITKPEIADLAAKTLIWVLSSTSNGLRDRTSKALINLLQYQRTALLNLMRIADSQDDLYIRERVYAIAYGCVLRCDDDEMIKMIGNYTYNNIFEKGNPPCHILLRDYASCIVDYAVYRGILDRAFLLKTRPPYSSALPKFPNKKEIDKYEIPYDESRNKKDERIVQNMIVGSVIKGLADFGHYVVESSCNRIINLSLEAYRTWPQFWKSLSRKKKELFDIYKLYYSALQGKSSNGSKYKHDSFYQQLVEYFTKERSAIDALLDSVFTEDERKKMVKLYFTYLENKDKPTYENKIDAWPIRYWIVKRVFELGYDSSKHGEYDILVNGYYINNGTPKVERIGKKYEWIAYHEIMGILADNYLVEDSYNDKPAIYKGPWFAYIRNLDPGCISRNLKKSESWMSAPEYIYWNMPYVEWRDTMKDFPNILKYIVKTDDNDQDWLCLHNYYNIKAPKQIGADEYRGNRKSVNIFIESFIVKESTKTRIVHDLEGKRLWGVSKAEYSSHSNMISRELGWSQCYMSQETGDRWMKLCGLTRYKALPSVENLNGNIEDDHSGISSSYKIPCLELINGLEMKYSDVDGQMLDRNGQLLSTYNKDNDNDEVLIRKKSLLDYLRNNKLDIIWTIDIEKNCYSGVMGGDPKGKVFDGVFYLDQECSVKGHLNIFDRWND